jgi:hypothetical protein
MGTIVSLRMQPLLDRYAAGTTGGASALLDPDARDAFAPDALAALQAGMADAVHESFFVMAAAAAVGLLAVMWFPKTLTAPDESPRETAEAVPAGAPAAGGG